MSSGANIAEVEDHYFSSNPPPKALPEHEERAIAFIAKHTAANRRVVLITSGGTTVPLEKNTVRFSKPAHLVPSPLRLQSQTRSYS